jgi:hypothetical protein
MLARFSLVTSRTGVQSTLELDRDGSKRTVRQMDLNVEVVINAPAHAAWAVLGHIATLGL